MVSTRSGKPTCAPSHLSEFFPSVTVETVLMYVWLTMALSRPFKEDSRTSSSVYASLLQAIDGARSLALWPQVVSQAPQHFWSSETRATCDGWFARQSVYWVISCEIWHRYFPLFVESFPLTQACPGQHVHSRFRKWMSSIRNSCSVRRAPPSSCLLQ